MKKKIGDLTLREVELFMKKCPLKTCEKCKEETPLVYQVICNIGLDSYFSEETLNQEIEVEE